MDENIAWRTKDLVYVIFQFEENEKSGASLDYTRMENYLSFKVYFGSI